MFSNNSISYNRLKEIYSGDPLTPGDRMILMKSKCVYLIHSDELNRSYIGETDDTLYHRIFNHWRSPHILGHLPKDFESKDTYVELLESECDNRSEEYLWHEEHRRLFPEVDLISAPGRPGIKGHTHKHSGFTRIKISENHADVSGTNNPMYGSDRSGDKNPSYGTVLYHNSLTDKQRRFPKDFNPGPEWIKGSNSITRSNCGFRSEACKTANRVSEKHLKASIDNAKIATEKGRIKWVFDSDKGYIVRYSQWNGTKKFHAKKLCKLTDWVDYCLNNSIDPSLLHYRTNNEGN